MNDKPRSLELFAGAGGLALGLERAGFQHDALVEIAPNACQTLRCNSAKHGWRIISRDVRELDYAEIAGGATLVAGGPPCQPFSIGGKARGHLDQRDLWPEAVRAVREIQPRAFLFENVRGLLRPAFSDYVEFIKLQLQFPEFPVSANVSWEDNLKRLRRHASQKNRLGTSYTVWVHAVNAADYGVPQKRKRVFFIGFREDLEAEWSFPEKTHSEEQLLFEKFSTADYWERHKLPQPDPRDLPDTIQRKLRLLETSKAPRLKPWVTVREALAGLPDPQSTINHAFSNHTFQGGARVYPGHTGSPLDEPAKALKAGDHGVPGGENMIAFPDGSVRYFTVRESCRLQTIPDCYAIAGSWSEAMRQLGNAVPAELARIIALSIRNALDQPLVEHSHRGGDQSNK
jgi:DNA (cytosine-5)-methyltransferase 1